MAGALFGTLPSTLSVAAHLPAARSLWWPAAVRARAAARASVDVAAARRPVTLKLLTAAGAAALMPGAEPVGGATTRLTNRELGDLTRGRRYAADFRKRRANERTMNGPFLVLATLVVHEVVAFVGVLGLRPVGLIRDCRGLHFRD